jgi:hypothetical protein
MPDRVMLEASMLLNRDSTNYVRGASATGSMNIVVSSRLLQIAASEPQFLEDSLSPFLGIRRRDVDLSFVRQLANSGWRGVESYRIPQDVLKSSFDGELRLFREILTEYVGDDLIAEILFEEWVFLTSNSWLFSKTHKAFEAMAEAGGTVVHVSQRVFQQVIRRTLKLNEAEPLTPCDSVRAAAKWVAVGGPPVVALLNPLAGAIAASVTGCILLMDP